MKKRVYLIPLVVAIVLILLSFVLAFAEASTKNIVGGVGGPTLMYVFLRGTGGLYASMFLIGVFALAVSFILFLTRKMK